MILNIGHRGASGYEPEDTIRAFERALEIGVDALGIDVHVCATGEVVVIHDNRVDRTTDGFGNVSEKNLHVLKELKTRDEERIPTLQETFEFVNKRAKLDIELKEDGCAAPTREIVRHYLDVEGWKNEDVFISSFLKTELEAYRALDAAALLSVLSNWTSNEVFEFAEKIRAYSLNINFLSLDLDVVREIHKKGFKVFAWTVNEKEDIEKMKSIGVDGIFSDFPDRVL